MLGWSLGLFCLNQPQHTVKRDFLKIILTFTELTITLCIVVNVIFMALDQYHADYPIEKYPDHPGMSPFLFSMLTNGNYFFTTIFAVESFVKLAAMSPRYFFAVSISYSVLFLIVYMYLYRYTVLQKYRHTRNFMEIRVIIKIFKILSMP